MRIYVFLICLIYYGVPVSKQLTQLSQSYYVTEINTDYHVHRYIHNTILNHKELLQNSLFYTILKNEELSLTMKFHNKTIKCILVIQRYMIVWVLVKTQKYSAL